MTFMTKVTNCHLFRAVTNDRDQRNVKHTNYSWPLCQPWINNQCLDTVPLADGLLYFTMNHVCFSMSHDLVDSSETWCTVLRVACLLSTCLADTLYFTSFEIDPPPGCVQAHVTVFPYPANRKDDNNYVKVYCVCHLHSHLSHTLSLASAEQLKDKYKKVPHSYYRSFYLLFVSSDDELK